MTFPETSLLPNERDLMKQELKIKARLAKENVPIVTIKPSKLNMGRVAVTHGSDDVIVGGVLRPNNAQLQQKSQVALNDEENGMQRTKYRKFKWFVYVLLI